MGNNIVKIIGYAGTLLGIGATLLSNWSGEKIMDDKIKKAVNEALKNVKN